MDTFFEGIDPDVVESVKGAVPEPKLSEFISKYKGTDSTEERLQALASFLSSIASQQEQSQGVSQEDRKKTFKVLGLVYGALDDWSSVASTWQKLVDIDDQESKGDHPDRDLAAMFNLGMALTRLEKWKTAEDIFRRLLPMLGNVPAMGKNSQQYVGSLCALMLAVGKQGEVEEARKLYSEHAAIVKQYDEPEYSAHANSAKKVLNDIEHQAREG